MNEVVSKSEDELRKKLEPSRSMICVVTSSSAYRSPITRRKPPLTHHLSGFPATRIQRLPTTFRRSLVQWAGGRRLFKIEQARKL